jgi:hypothetical protein
MLHNEIELVKYYFLGVRNLSNQEKEKLFSRNFLRLRKELPTLDHYRRLLYLYKKRCARKNVRWWRPPTRSPEAVTPLGLPHNVACGFPALRSSKVASQHSDKLQLDCRQTDEYSSTEFVRVEAKYFIFSDDLSIEVIR